MTEFIVYSLSDYLRLYSPVQPFGDFVMEIGFDVLRF